MAIIGIDEVGRGPWAGPLVVGAVILPEKKPEWVFELDDSKKLSERKREELNRLILEGAEAYGLGWVWQYEIDEMGLAAALREATKRALGEMKKGYAGGEAGGKNGLARVGISEIMIDGTQNFLAGTELAGRVTTLVKGDSLIREISAASIIAKVARDRYMVERAAEFPEYGFEKHKGYGTALHRAAIEKYGVSALHRLSIKPLAKILGAEDEQEGEAQGDVACSESGNRMRKRKDTTGIGRRAEEAAARFLEGEGQEILVRNYKNRICEIDIVSRDDGRLYFVEVRYRRDDRFGGGLESITAGKRRQMEFAARVFLANRPEFSELDPVLAAVEVTGEDFRVREYVVLD